MRYGNVRALEVSLDQGGDGGSGSGSGSGDDRSWVTSPRCSSSSSNKTETHKGSCVCVCLIYSYRVAKTQQQQQKPKSDGVNPEIGPRDVDFLVLKVGGTESRKPGAGGGDEPRVNERERLEMDDDEGRRELVQRAA